MSKPEFIASFWTLSGNSHPTGSGISELPFEVRTEAAAEAGYVGFAFYNPDLAAVHKTRKYSDIRKHLESSGLGFVELETLVPWFAKGEAGAAAKATLAEIFEGGAELGAHHLKVIGDISGQYPPSQMVDNFGALCADAAKAGMKIALELTPLANLTTIEDGVDLVRASGAKNAGLLIDVWHMGRAGIDMDSLDQVPAELIVGVELGDADQEVRGTLMEDTMNNRRFCGEGALRPDKLVAAVQRAGFKGPYGIELLSHEIRAMPVKEAARKAIETSRAQFK